MTTMTSNEMRLPSMCHFPTSTHWQSSLRRGRSRRLLKNGNKTGGFDMGGGDMKLMRFNSLDGNEGISKLFFFVECRSRLKSVMAGL